MKFRIATWNINSIRIRLGGLQRLAQEAAPDILCLQETKVEDGSFPYDAVRSLGYDHVYASGEKGYNGVAILSRRPLEKMRSVALANSADRRHIAVTLPGGAELHNFYVPAGGDIPDPAVNLKFDFKLRFLDAMIEWCRQELTRQTPVIMVGDLNVAPHPNDVWSHKQLLQVVSHTIPETTRMETLRGTIGWCDSARHFTPDTEKLFSWWSYRNRDWRKSDRGRRLDHIWVTEPLRHKLISSSTLRDARDWASPSDHVPVITEIAA